MKTAANIFTLRGSKDRQVYDWKSSKLIYQSFHHSNKSLSKGSQIQIPILCPQYT